MAYNDSGLPVSMIRLVDYTLKRDNTKNNSINSKLFSGEMYVELLNEKELYRVSGDFYNNGSMSISSGGSIGIGEFASLSFQVTNSSSHYAYCFYADTSRIV